MLKAIIRAAKKAPRAARRARGVALGTTAIEYGTPPTKPPPTKPTSRLEARRLARYGRKLATAFRPDALKFQPYAYAFGDVPRKKPKAKTTQLRTTTLQTTQQGQSQILRMLGDDAPVASSGDSLILQQILDQSKNQSAWMERWVKKDEFQRWLQIGATLAIPLAAAVWKAIFRAARKGKKDS